MPLIYNNSQTNLVTQFNGHKSFWNWRNDDDGDDDSDDDGDDDVDDDDELDSDHLKTAMWQ